MNTKKPLLYNIFKDAFAFFDKRWSIIVLGALLSVGAADLAVYLINLLAPLGSIDLSEAAGRDFTLPNYVLLEAVAVFFAGIWFRGFVAVLANDTFQAQHARDASILKRAALLYPRIFILNLSALIITYFAAAIGLLMMSASIIGVVFLIPALLYSVWFSLVSPVAVMDDTRGIVAGLRRSRSLVTGHFMQVLFLMFIVVTPGFAMVGVDEKSALFWPILIFINLSTSILDALFITFAYLNLRAVLGEELVPVSEASPDPTDGPL